MEKGAKVKIKGVVSCVPGILGSQIFYLSGSGIQVYLYDKDFPELNLGDEIEIQGSLSSYQNEARINLSSKEDIKILQKNQPINLEEITINEINENTEGFLIKVKGEVIETLGNTFYLADETNKKIKIYIKESTKIEKSRMQKGDQMEVTGIVSQLGEEYRVLPRFQKDIRILNSNVQTPMSNKILNLNDKTPSLHEEQNQNIKQTQSSNVKIQNQNKNIKTERQEEKKQEEKKSEAGKTATTAGIGASATLAAIYRRQILLFLAKIFFKG
jgi:DNA/RNA endonuclease YhcR with UshA esterase domain